MKILFMSKTFHQNKASVWSPVNTLIWTRPVEAPRCPSLVKRNKKSKGVWGCSRRQSHRKITQRCVISLWCFGMAVWVCVSVCPALSALRDVKGPDLIMVSLPPPPASRPPPSTLEIVNTNAHSHPNKADQRKCSRTVQYIRQWRSLKRQDSCQRVATHSDGWYRWNPRRQYGGGSWMVPWLTCVFRVLRGASDMMLNPVR